MSKGLDEASYERGERAVWNQLLGQALRELRQKGEPSTETEKLGYLVKEREMVIAELRDLAGQLDVEWDDDLRLSDMVRQIGKAIRD